MEATFKKIVLAAAIFAGSTAIPTLSTAEEASIRASCTQNNVLVYRETVPSESLDQKRADIADRFPTAMCVFLEIPTEGTQEVGAPSVQSPPKDVGRGIDTELITALAAITDKTSPDRIGETVDASFSQRFGDYFKSKKEVAPKVGLAIGIYDDVELSTVLSHWRSAASGTTWLSRMTPTVSTAGKITMLSLDGIKDEDVAKVCEEVEDRGLKCLAAY